MTVFDGTDKTPLSGEIDPVIISSSVVFPAPFGPTSPIFLPSFNMPVKAVENFVRAE